MSAPALFARPSTGGDFSLEGRLTTGGGGDGAAAGGDFAVKASVGEPAPEALSGGDFQVIGDLVAATTVIPVEVALDLTAADGQVTLTWPAGAVGYVLESSPALGAAANWQPVLPAPAANTFTTPFAQALRFFRLRQP